MHLLPVTALLLLHSLLASAYPSALQHLRYLAGWTQQQRPIIDHSLASPAHLAAAGHREAAPNSVGMLLTTAEDEDVLHIWLPLGKRLYTRDSPELPLHPITARITTMIRSTPEIATLEHLDRVFCRIYPRYNQTQDVPHPDALAVQIWRSDELVRLAEVSQRPWREIESYECW